MEMQFEKIASQIPTGRPAGQLPLPLAMAYIPPQKWTIAYEPQQALAAGTLFPALHLPFEGAVRK